MNGKGQYPTQPTYPVQPPGNPSVFPQTIPLPQAPPYTEAPPAYSEPHVTGPKLMPPYQMNSRFYGQAAKDHQLPCPPYETLSASNVQLMLYRPSFVHPGAATVPTMSAAYPGASLYLPMAQSVAMGPMGSSVPVAFYPVGPVYPPGSAVLVEGGFDAGARFATGAPANIPPPPPGCPPNAAQLAVMQGANVLVTQRKGNFFMGGSDGGYTIW